MSATVGASERIAALYGPEAEAELRRFTGVVHVVAAQLDPGLGDAGEWATIRIGPDSPGSDADRFALALSRARADAIVVTGQILRDEPELAYAAPGFGLASWRRDQLGRETPPRLLILTRGERPLDPAHPALHGWAEPVLFTGRARAATLAEQPRPDRLELVGVDEPSLAAALTWLREAGCAVISIEAGPTTMAPYYRAGYRADEQPSPVTELMLSEFLGPLEPALRGPSFADRAVIEDLFERRHAVTVVEPSGRWRLSRWRRRGSQA